MSLRQFATGAALAIAGLLAAVGMGLLANSISGDNVGLSAEPLECPGETLAPRADDRAEQRAERRAAARERVRKRRIAARRRAQRKAAARTTTARDTTIHHTSTHHDGRRRWWRGQQRSRAWPGTRRRQLGLRLRRL